MEQDSIYIIKMVNREFLPKPGIQKELLIESLDGESMGWGIMQLWSNLTGKDRVRLLESGIGVKQFLGGFNFIFSYNSNSQFDEIAHLLRWAGPFQGEDKLSKALYQNRFEKWAIDSKDRVKIMVSFFEGVPDKRKRKILSKYSDEVINNEESHQWNILIAKDKLKMLATEVAIKRMEQGPHPAGFFN